jgi:lipid-A-disaccharide synthase
VASSPLIVLVAGETSGDNLGAHLIEALRARMSDARFAGIPGPRMLAAGCEAWDRAEDLAVMGLFEIIPHLPRLLRIRRNLLKRVLAAKPDVYVGVDFKEFNLRVARRVKKQGIRTVQYVSPQIWAWRQGRVKTIGRAVDLVLCLLPFEKRFYDEHGVRAVFVGHPLADQIPLHVDSRAARAALGRWPAQRGISARGAAALDAAGVRDRVTLVDGNAQQVMAASDVILLASGTATLEATLVGRPMVVAYRLSLLTTFLLKTLKLFKAPFFAQPNLLAGRQVVPEYFNDEVRADVLGPAVLTQLGRADRDQLVQTFASIHETLRRDASARAAEAIVELLRSGER